MAVTVTATVSTSHVPAGTVTIVGEEGPRSMLLGGDILGKRLARGAGLVGEADGVGVCPCGGHQ